MEGKARGRKCNEKKNNDNMNGRKSNGCEKKCEGNAKGMKER